MVGTRGAAGRSECGLDKIRPEMSVNCLFPRVSVNMRVKYLVLLIKRITSLNTSSRGPGRVHRHACYNAGKRGDSCTSDVCDANLDILHLRYSLHVACRAVVLGRLIRMVWL